MRRMRQLLFRMTEPLLWTLTLLPLYVMISASQFGHLQPAWFCLLITLAFGCLIVSGVKHRLMCALLGVGFLFLAAAPYYSQLPILILPILSSTVLLYTASARSQDKERVNPFIRTMLGTVLYLIAQYGAWRSDLSSFSAFYFISPTIVCGFLLFFMIELLILNGRTVHDEAVGDQVPSSVIRHNIFLVVMAFLVAVLIACIPIIGKALAQVWTYMKMAFYAVVEFLLSLLPQSDQPVGGGGGGGLSEFGAMEAAEPSLLAIWLERIVAVLAFLAIGILVFLGVKILIRKLRVLLRRLKAVLATYLASASQDYVDEISDTRNTKEEKHATFFRRRRKRTYRRDMSNAEKVRYTYGVLMDHHPEWKDSTTAREQLGASAAVYEKVRYAEMDATEEEAEHFRNLVHNKKPPEEQAAKGQKTE